MWKVHGVSWCKKQKCYSLNRATETNLLPKLCNNTAYDEWNVWVCSFVSTTTRPIVHTSSQWFTCVFDKKKKAVRTERELIWTSLPIALRKRSNWWTDVCRSNNLKEFFIAYPLKTIWIVLAVTCLDRIATNKGLFEHVYLLHWTDKVLIEDLKQLYLYRPAEERLDSLNLYLPR